MRRYFNTIWENEYTPFFFLKKVEKRHVDSKPDKYVMWLFDQRDIYVLIFLMFVYTVIVPLWVVLRTSVGLAKFIIKMYTLAWKDVA